MLTTNDIGGRIAVARKLKNISQSELAEQLAVSAQAVGKWERGESMPDIIMFTRLAATLGTDLNYFAGGASNAPNIKPAVTQNELRGETAYNKNVHNEIMDGETADGETTDGETVDIERFGWNMSGGNWVDADFSGLYGLAEKFSGSNIEKCKFIEVEMAGMALKHNKIENSDFSRSDLSRCKFTSSNLENSVFVGCDFSGSSFFKSSISDCDFSGANLTSVYSKWGYVKKVNLAGALLHKSKFEFTQLTEITFSGELKECSFVNCDFARIVFEGAELSNCFFKNAKLKRAKFINCKADRLTYAFMKNCKADLSDVTIVALQY